MLNEQAAQEIIARRKKLLQTPGPVAFGAANGFGSVGVPGAGMGNGSVTAGLLGGSGF